MTRTFDEWTEGETFELPERTVTEAMVETFAELSGDVNPLHLDAEAAAAGRFGERVAHGMLVASLVTGLWMEGAPEVFEGVVLSGLDRVRWLKPVPLGTRIRATAEVTHVEDRGGYGLVVVRNEALDDAGDVVLALEARLAVDKA